MAFRISHKSTMGLLKAVKKPMIPSLQIRTLATVEGNTPRQIPTTRERQTPISHDTANLTIKVKLHPQGEC